jgi:hypothetical protein
MGSRRASAQRRMTPSTLMAALDFEPPGRVVSTKYTSSQTCQVILQVWAVVDTGSFTPTWCTVPVSTMVVGKPRLSFCLISASTMSRYETSM